MAKTTTNILRDMKVGESVSFPITRTTSIRALASTYSIQWARKYVTEVNKDKRIITVTRVRNQTKK